MGRQITVATKFKNNLIGNVWVYIIHAQHGIVDQGFMDKKGKAHFACDYSPVDGEFLFVGYKKEKDKILCGHESLTKSNIVNIELEQYSLSGEKCEKTS